LTHFQAKGILSKIRNGIVMITRTTDQKWFVLVAIGTGTFMSALDGSVVNIILPVVRQAFGSSVATIEWVVTIYLLVVSSLLLTFGRLGDLVGHKSVYISGFTIFIASSTLCGLAPSAEILVLFRGIQAIGAAMIYSNSPAILTSNFPSAQRGKALGLAATMTYLGLTVGPTLGGWLAEQFSWRYVFYINVPVGLIALVLSIAFIPRDVSIEKEKKFDIAGAVTFMAGLATLMLGLNKGAEWGWTSWSFLGLILMSVVLIVIFVRTERRSKAPMLDLGLFSNPLFTASTANALLNYVCVYSIVFLIPFYLIQGRELEPSLSGLLLTCQPIVMAVVAPISGTLSDRIGSRTPGMIGMAILAAGLFLLSQSGSQSPLWMIMLGLSISGLGTGLFISPNNSALMGSAPAHRQGIASGILASSRNVGMVLGIGLAGAILTSHLTNGSQEGLFQGVRMGLLAASGVALLGVVVAFIKER